jgi:transglutaminase-like putative cysteine protease
LEIPAALLVPAATVGFTRVFVDTATILPIMGAALLSSAVAVVLRRLSTPLLVAAPISVGILTLLIVNRYAPGTSTLGLLPTSATLDQLQLLIEDLVVNFQELRTPVPDLPPFVAAGMIGAWLMAFLTDWGAMRLRLAFEPVLPAGLLFLFSSIPPISAGGQVLVPSVVFAAAVALWAVSQRAANLMEHGQWLTGDGRRGPATVAVAGAVLASCAVIAGTVLGTRLPGAEAGPLFSFEDQADPTRFVVSPYVNLESRLVDQTTAELFTVTADEPTFWRIAGLDEYENGIWKVAGDFSPEDGELPDQLGTTATVTDVTQEYSITGLSAIWLPAAFSPAEIVEATEQVTWNAETSSLTVANGVPNSDGVAYTLRSEVAAFTGDQLRSASAEIPLEITQRYLALPGEVSPQVTELANRIAGGLPSRYDQMLALQNHFASYDYSVSLSPRVGDPIEQFLRERVGFCQQFAGTYALMARALGAPARVATGFTWGDAIETDPTTGRTTYQVTGRHTHAWVEVYFADLGWVIFDPTPGRGLPGGESYTGQPAEQSSAVEPALPDPAEEPATPPNAVPTPPADQPDNPLEDALPTEPETTTPDPVVVPSLLFRLGDLLAVIWPVLAFLALVGAYVGGVPLLRRLRKSARRRAAVSPVEQVEVAWADAVDSLDIGYGIERFPAETRQEFAGRIVQDHRVPAEGVPRLAKVATEARFHPGGVGAEEARKALSLADAFDEAIRRRVPATVRLRREIDPRRLLGLRKARVVIDSDGTGDSNHRNDASGPPPPTPDREPVSV